MIDRQALVHRHHPAVDRFDPLSAFTVGNGRFAFTADATGMQTFPDLYHDGIPLHTQSQWGWHATPRPDTVRDQDVLNDYDVGGRDVPYADRGTRDPTNESASWLRANPHRLDLGRIGLDLPSITGRPIDPSQLSGISQTLDLWRGHLRSTFTLDGTQYIVTTACHPDHDTLAFRIEASTNVSRLGVRLSFPYGSEDWKHAADWNRPDAHTSQANVGSEGATIDRHLDLTRYSCRLGWTGHVSWTQTAEHHFVLAAQDADSLELVVSFAEKPNLKPPPEASRVFDHAAAWWAGFWQDGAAIELRASRDKRAPELERRLVLSQYLTAVNCSGDTPPQETGLTFNSWFGKMHLEMHWWHATHFALWDRSELMRPSLDWYLRILPNARAHAQRQGYPGARWPKMVDHHGVDSPSPIAVFLLWQQPHPIYLAELIYRGTPCPETLERYSPLVFESAEFMAAFATHDPADKRFHLAPPLIPAQESYGQQRTSNRDPTYELAYWYWGLDVAQAWRHRLGLAAELRWAEVKQHLAAPSITAGCYDAIASPPHLIRKDHPSMLAALGVLPATPLIDPRVMARTLDSVLADWDWPSTWGWDYPVLAMTAARLGRPHDAVDALFHPAAKNCYLNNGHNHQDKRLPIYLPGNGGLLTAAAMMAAGWDHASDHHAPGFPRDGSWEVQHEGLRTMP